MEKPTPTDFTSAPGEIESPDWHRRVLEERLREAAIDDAAFIDWETAKEEIRRRIS
jgi:hypothetical protein